MKLNRATNTYHSIVEYFVILNPISGLWANRSKGPFTLDDNDVFFCHHVRTVTLVTMQPISDDMLTTSKFCVNGPSVKNLNFRDSFQSITLKVKYLLSCFEIDGKTTRPMDIFYTCQTLVFIPFLSCCTVYTILYVIWTTTFLWKHLIKWDKNIDITSSHCIDHGLGFTRQVLSRRYYLWVWSTSSWYASYWNAILF